MIWYSIDEMADGCCSNKPTATTVSLARILGCERSRRLKMYKQSTYQFHHTGWFHQPHLAMTPGTPSAQKANEGIFDGRCSCWIDMCWDLSNYSGCINCYLQTESIGKRICAWGLASCSRCFLLSDSLWKMQQSFTHAFSFQCHLRYNSVSAAINNLNDGLFASTSAWQSMASCGLQPGNIWQHGLQHVTILLSGSRRVLRGVLRFPTKPGTWPADIAYELWNAWNAWKLSRGAVLELWQTEITTYFGEKTRKRSLFFALVSGQLFVPIFMAFHGTAMKFQQKHWIHCREVWSLGVTGESLE